MVAGITIRADGRAEHAYTGEVGWHGLGNKLRVGAPLEEWRDAAGLDFEYVPTRVRYFAGKDDLRIDEKHQVILHSRTRKNLAITSTKFKLVQPIEILEYFRNKVEKVGYQMDTAGTLFDGEKIWGYAKNGDEMHVGKGDIIKSGLLCCTACDGSLATTVKFVDTRPVCWNTISAGLRESGATHRTSHRSVFVAEDADEALGLTVDGTKAFKERIEQFRRLAETPLTHEEVVQMTAELYKPGAAKLAIDEYKKVLDSRQVVEVLKLSLEGRAKGSDLPGVKGTAWGWLNAVTEFEDHGRRVRDPQNRFNSAQFGAGDATKTRALTLASAA